MTTVVGHETMKHINKFFERPIFTDLHKFLCMLTSLYSTTFPPTRLSDGSNIADRRVIDANCTDAFTLQECKRFQLLPAATSPCSAAADMYAGVQCTSSCELKFRCNFIYTVFCVCMSFLVRDRYGDSC